ncbi:MAG: hypothetical protein AB7S38_23445 [Vulcanimicrobiota bacterium]
MSDDRLIEISSDKIGSLWTDKVITGLKAGASFVPFVGGAIAEAIGAIPGQRLDRVESFVKALEARLQRVEQASEDACWDDAEFLDVVEEGAVQAARATRKRRIDQIATVVASSLTSTQVSHIQAKHLLKILGDINDIELLILRSYYQPALSTDHEFRRRHGSVITPPSKSNPMDEERANAVALDDSYRAHLARLGLLKPKYKVNPKTKTPVYDSEGRPELNGYRITSLGDLLLRVAEVDLPDEEMI